MDDLRQRIAEFVKTAPDMESLSEYLVDVAQKISPTRFAVTPITLKKAIKQLFEENKDNYMLALKDPVFGSLSDFFSLTTGLHVIAGAVGHGKTLWAMQWAKQAAMAGQKVLFVSLEMSPQDLGARTLTEFTDFTLNSLLTKDYSETEKLAVQSFIDGEELNWLDNILVETLGDFDFFKIQPRLWDRVMRYQPKLVIVDYAQMIYDSREKTNLQSLVLSKIARELKLFADNTQSAVLLLSQLNREAMKAAKSRNWEQLGYVPMSNDYVKESGGIVEAADSVQLVCIPERIENCPESLKRTFQVVVDKSRRIGHLGTVHIPLNTYRMRFGD